MEADNNNENKQDIKEYGKNTSSLDFEKFINFLKDTKNIKLLNLASIMIGIIIFISYFIIKIQYFPNAEINNILSTAIALFLIGFTYLYNATLWACYSTFYSSCFR